VRVADVTDPAALHAAVAAAEPEWVFHLAARTFVPDAATDPAAAFTVNATGTLQLLAAVARHVPRCRVVVVGSADAYGAVPDADQPIVEAQPLRPLSGYGASKAAADLLAGQWADGAGLDVVRVRPFNHTGPGQDGRFVCADFARQLRAVAGARNPPRIEVGDLDPVRDFSDVRDVVAAYVAVAERGVRGAAYNVCSGVGRSIRSVLDDLIAAVGVPVEVVSVAARRRPLRVPRLVGSAAALHAATGWQPAIAWPQTLADLLAAVSD
jgi:GDP-4-dehydro-6-deoxy-D-mannose reductase